MFLCLFGLAAGSLFGAYSLGRNSVNTSAAMTDPAALQSVDGSEGRAAEVVGVATGADSKLVALDETTRLEPVVVVLDPLSAEGLASFSKLSLHDILATEGAVDHLYQLTGYLKNLSPENLNDVLATFEENTKESRRNYQDWTLLMDAWSGFDPKGALNYIADSEKVTGRSRHALAEQVVEKWAETDPFGALDFAQSETISGTDKSRLIRELVESAADKDMSAAVQMTELIEDRKTRLESTARVAGAYFKENPAAAQAWAESLPDEEARRKALEQVSLGISKEDPQQAAEYAISQFDGEVPWEAARRIAEDLGRDDPATGIDFVNQISNDKSRKIAFAEVMDEWTKRDPVEAANLLNQLPQSEEIDWAVAAFARRVAEEDSAVALDWASSIIDEGTRKKIVKEVNRIREGSDRKGVDD